MAESQDRFPYEYDANEKYDGQTLIKKFRDRFPLLTIVIDGHDGMNNYEDFCDEQVYRVDMYTTQRRVLMRETSVYGTRQMYPYISVPVNIRHKFCVIKSKYEREKPSSLNDILRTNRSFPIMVNFASNETSVRIGSTTRKVENIQNLLILDHYEENFLAGNCVQNGVMFPDVVYMGLNPLIKYAVITGIRGRSEENFRKHIHSQTEFLIDNKIVFDPYHGNPEMTRLTAEGTGTGNPISFIKPNLIPEITSLSSLPSKDVRGSYVKLSQVEENTMRKLPAIPPLMKKTEKLPAVLQQTNTTERNERGKITAVVNPLKNPGKDTHKFPSDILNVQGEYNRTFDPSYDRPQLPTPVKSEYDYVSEIPHRPFSACLKELCVEDVSDYLKELKLEKYVDKFATELIDGELLSSLTEDLLLEEFHLTRLEVVRLTKFIKTGHIPR